LTGWPGPIPYGWGEWEGERGGKDPLSPLLPFLSSGTLIGLYNADGFPKKEGGFPFLGLFGLS